MLVAVGLVETALRSGHGDARRAVTDFDALLSGYGPADASMIIGGLLALIADGVGESGATREQVSQFLERRRHYALGLDSDQSAPTD